MERKQANTRRNEKLTEKLPRIWTAAFLNVQVVNRQAAVLSGSAGRLYLAAP